MVGVEQSHWYLHGLNQTRFQFLLPLLKIALSEQEPVLGTGKELLPGEREPAQGPVLVVDRVQVQVQVQGRDMALGLVKGTVQELDSLCSFSNLSTVFTRQASLQSKKWFLVVLNKKFAIFVADDRLRDQSLDVVTHHCRSSEATGTMTV